MPRPDGCPPGRIAFWEEADRASVGDHPLKHELAAHLAAAARYEELLCRAEEGENGEAVDHLTRLLEDQLLAVDRLDASLRRGRD